MSQSELRIVKSVIKSHYYCRSQYELISHQIFPNPDYSIYTIHIHSHIHILHVFEQLSHLFISILQSNFRRNIWSLNTFNSPKWKFSSSKEELYLWALLLSTLNTTTTNTYLLFQALSLNINRATVFGFSTYNKTTHSDNRPSDQKKIDLTDLRRLQSDVVLPSAAGPLTAFPL